VLDDVLFVSGEIDLSNAGMFGILLGEAVARGGCRCVDLTGVRYLAAAGVRELFEMFAVEPQTELRVDPDTAVAEVVAITGLSVAGRVTRSRGAL
jgi:anti-anti-sigma factor